MAKKRPDGRRFDEMRSVRIIPDVNLYAEGSVMIEYGNTKVLCTASLENRVPPFLEGKGVGWVTAEYAMLPRATHTRSGRNPGGRGTEIQRLVGRALRAAVNTKALGPRQLLIDCDVIQADGGTRTAAITGGWVALALAVRRLRVKENLTVDPIVRAVSAVSTGIVSGEARLDLEYREDSSADTDFNFVMTNDGRFIEMQGTAESEPFSGDELAQLMTLARKGGDELFALQQQALAEAKP
jgi:ribonuclease PH